MSKLISIYDVEFTKDKKISKTSPYVKRALKRLRQKRRFHYENYEEVLSLAELILTMYEIEKETNKRRKSE